MIHIELALNDKLKQDAQVLHGDIAQSQRETTLKGFRNGKFKCIICTDVLARGIDIPQVGKLTNNGKFIIYYYYEHQITILRIKIWSSIVNHPKTLKVMYTVQEEQPEQGAKEKL